MGDIDGALPTRVDLDSRRRNARGGAVLAALAGVTALAITAAMTALVAIFIVARMWTWIRRRDIDQFFLWDLAPGTAIGAAVLAVVVLAVLLFRWFWVGATDRVLGALKAVRVDEGHTDQVPKAHVQQIRGVVDAVAVGMGKDGPEIWVAKDPTPNSLALRSRDRRAVVLTSGALAMPRSEQEVMVAHEMAHLWAKDAQWVTAGTVALTTTRRIGQYMWSFGILVIGVTGIIAFKKGVVLWGTLGAGIGLFATGAVASLAFGTLERGVRRQSDELADVAAVHLAKDPWSLGKLCLRLADDENRVGAAPTVAENLWFEIVHSPGVDGDIDPADVIRSRKDMYDRARRAYAEAREPMPHDAQARMEAFLNEHPEA